MFGINKRQSKEISTSAIKNIFGYILQNRPTIINYGEVSSKNIYVTPIIGQAHMQNQKVLSEEFDALALYLAANAYISLGVSRAQVFDALDELMKEFLEDEVFSTPAEMAECSKKFHQILNAYLDAQKSSEVARLLLSRISTEPLGRFADDAINVLGKQLDGHRKAMLSYIKREINS